MSILLSQLAPDFAAELQGLLQADEEAIALQLSDAATNVEISDRCHCGDDFCATMKTPAYPGAPFPHGYRTLALMATEGYVNVDFSPAGEIMQIEVLFRPEVKARLDAAFPLRG
jgi:hypothetical protein